MRGSADGQLIGKWLRTSALILRSPAEPGVSKDGRAKPTNFLRGDGFREQFGRASDLVTLPILHIIKMQAHLMGEPQTFGFHLR